MKSKLQPNHREHTEHLWELDYGLWMYTMCVLLCSTEVTEAVRTCSLSSMKCLLQSPWLTQFALYTEWPFGLSQTDVCCCQSHALKNTTGSQNMGVTATDWHVHTHTHTAMVSYARNCFWSVWHKVVIGHAGCRGCEVLTFSLGACTFTKNNYI